MKKESDLTNLASKLAEMLPQFKHAIREAKYKYSNLSLLNFLKTTLLNVWNYIRLKRSQRSSPAPDECCACATLLNNYFENVFRADDNRNPPFDYIGRFPRGIGELIIIEAGMLALLPNIDTKKRSDTHNIPNR